MEQKQRQQKQNGDQDDSAEVVESVPQSTDGFKNKCTAFVLMGSVGLSALGLFSSVARFFLRIEMSIKRIIISVRFRQPTSFTTQIADAFDDYLYVCRTSQFITVTVRE